MAIRRGYSHLTALVPTKCKVWITRKARKEMVSRSRLLGRILKEAQEADEGTPQVQHIQHPS